MQAYHSLDRAFGIKLNCSENGADSMHLFLSLERIFRRL